jgi:hypothetical protein
VVVSVDSGVEIAAAGVGVTDSAADVGVALAEAIVGVALSGASVAASGGVWVGGTIVWVGAEAGVFSTAGKAAGAVAHPRRSISRRIVARIIVITSLNRS